MYARNTSLECEFNSNNLLEEIERFTKTETQKTLAVFLKHKKKFISKKT